MLANFPGTRFYGKASLPRAAVSIAAHDLKARLLRVPLHVLLGGARRDPCRSAIRSSGSRPWTM